MKIKYLLLMMLWLMPGQCMECMERSVSVEDFGRALFGDMKEILQSWIAMAKSKKIDVNARNKWGDTALVLAVHKGNVEVIRELLNVPGIDVNAKTNNDWQALICAAFIGNVEVVRELIKVPGIHVNAKEEDGLTALIWAANQGNVEVVRELLNVPGIDVNAQEKIGRTALIVAALYGNREVVKELLRVPGIDINAKDNDGWTALMIVAYKGNVEVVRELLKVPGIDANVKDKYMGRTALMWAAYKGNVEVVGELLRVPGIDVNAKAKDSGRTALMCAAYKRGVEIVRELLKVPGIEVNAKTKDGHSALSLAIKKSRKQNALLLWAVGAQEEGLPALTPEIQKTKEEGKAIFNGILSALSLGNLEEVKGYVNRGFSLMIEDLRGNNPLHIAVIRNHQSLAKYLITSNKQWLRDKNKDGLSPLDLIYGHWGDKNNLWNALIAELPREFTSDVEKAKRDWQVFKEKAFREGYKGMQGFPSEKEK